MKWGAEQQLNNGEYCVEGAFIFFVLHNALYGLIQSRRPEIYSKLRRSLQYIQNLSLKIERQRWPEGLDKEGT